jgi:hypothetical protein
MHTYLGLKRRDLLSLLALPERIRDSTDEGVAHGDVGIAVHHVLVNQLC